MGSAGWHGRLSSGLWAGLEGGVVGGRLGREGAYAHTELTHAVVQQKPAQHCKAAMLQLKTFKIKKQKPYYAKKRINLSVNYGLWVMMFIYYNKGTTLVGDVDHGAGYGV